MSIVTDYLAKLDYFADQLGMKVVKSDEGLRWGYQGTTSCSPLAIKKAFIYLDVLSRYNPEGSNNITEEQSNFIFTQLGKLLPC